MSYTSPGYDGVFQSTESWIVNENGFPILRYENTYPGGNEFNVINIYGGKPSPYTNADFYEEAGSRIIPQPKPTPTPQIIPEITPHPWPRPEDCIPDQVAAPEPGYMLVTALVLTAMTLKFRRRRV